MDQENLMDVEWMGRASGHRMRQHLKHVLQAARVVEVHIRSPVGAIGKERELQIAVSIQSLKAAGMIEARRRVMQYRRDLGEEAGKRRVFHFLA